MDKKIEKSLKCVGDSWNKLDDGKKLSVKVGLITFGLGMVAGLLINRKR